ncbi:hypothetical protein C2857_007535 [Epichloe festucae Fl1]|uniref:Zn(2)-C6 fungal-type domain-containing protein n=1 Tax=Epichloe festucae (strain Fl1) TaxID=877507 RepID=A0A7S9KMK6_EPIFF|nr:hypothetical protein C2857_007535 [Epichloe festucae Fl1]
MANRASEDKADTTKLPTAKWGAACAACATAKAKCIRSNPDQNAKCQRLLKECTGQVHRPRKKRQAKPSRTAQIEERLNGLVNLLQASGELSSNHTPLNTLSDAAASEQSAMAQDTPSASSTTSYQPYSNTLTIPETYNSNAVPSCICRPQPGSAPPPPDSDDVLLELFRTQMQPLFPFVIIPPSISASELQASRPFLMSAIRMVTSFRNLRSMSAQLYRLMSHVADHVLLRSARSLELLQGILVMIAWHQYHCLIHAQLNNLLSLAMSMVSDLSLNYPPGVREQARLMVARPDEPAGRTNEERRALLGVWFLTCNVSVSLNRIESMKYTPYVQECLKVLENGREYESDITLMYLIRIQRLTERIFEFTSKDRAEEDIPGIPSAPTSAYIAAFQKEIDSIRDSLPARLQNDSVFMTYLNTAKLRLYEPPAVDITLVKSLVESMTAGQIGRGTPLDKLYQSSAALRNWFDAWALVPASSYFRHPLSSMSQLVYALTMLGRWAQLATPRTVYEGATPMPVGDGSSMYSSDSQIPTKSLAENRLPQKHNQGGDPKQQCGDQDLIQAVAALQLQLQSQPGLIINIPGILSTVCTRCEQVNNLYQQTLPEDEKTENNVWTFSALKVRITRVKLEKWAETVAAAAEGSYRVGKVGNVQHWRGSYPQTSDATGNMGQPAGGLVSNCFEQDQTQIHNVLGSTPWTSDLLDGIDPTLWFGGYLDWGTLAMNSMANPLGPGEPSQQV